MSTHKPSGHRLVIPDHDTSSQQRLSLTTQRLVSTFAFSHALHKHTDTRFPEKHRKTQNMKSLSGIINKTEFHCDSHSPSSWWIVQRLYVQPQRPVCSHDLAESDSVGVIGRFRPMTRFPVHCPLDSHCIDCGHCDCYFVGSVQDSVYPLYPELVINIRPLLRRHALASCNSLQNLRQVTSLKHVY